MAKLIGYTVTGSGPFPLDMLRYDCSWPRYQDDVTAIPYHSKHTTQYTISLLSINKPTIARWASFGWRVDDGSIQRVGA